MQKLVFAAPKANVRKMVQDLNIPHSNYVYCCFPSLKESVRKFLGIFVISIYVHDLFL